MGYLHVEVVNNDRKIVGRRAFRSRDNEVVEFCVLENDCAPDSVFDDDFAVPLDGLADLDGMFGLAIWDEPARTLVLARDRAGEKPLFVSRLGGELWFASEVQALLLDPAISRELDEEAVFQYLALGYVPEPRTAFRDVRKIEAGTIVRFTAGPAAEERTRRYWEPGSFSSTATRSPARRSSRRLPDSRP